MKERHKIMLIENSQELKLRKFQKAKSEEYAIEDAIYGDHNLWAIADGVSQSFEPQLLSEPLTKYMCESIQNYLPIEHALLRAKYAYREASKALVKKLHDKFPHGVPQHKIQRYLTKQYGASTLMAIKKSDNLLHVYYLGDCNLFFISQDFRIMDSFPFNKSEQLDRIPESVIGDVHCMENIKYEAITIPEEPCYIVSATDAIAKYILMYQHVRTCIERLMLLKDQDSFSSWAKTHWDHKLNYYLENDDLTIHIYRNF